MGNNKYRKLKYRTTNFLKYLFLIISSIILLFPIYWLIITSFKPQGELIAKKQTFLPHNFTLDAYIDPVKGIFSSDSNFLNFFFNSVIIAFVATFLCLLVGSLAAYSLARFNIKLNKNGRLEFIILAARMLPTIIVVVPMYIIMKNIGLLNTYWAMFIVYTGFNLPFAIWMLTAFFREIPVEIEESAMVDGNSRLQAMFKIVLPLASPGLVSTAVFTLILTINEFLFAVFLLNTNEMMTLPAGIATYVTDYQIIWGPLAAASTVAILPVLVFSFFVQKYLVRGMTMGAVKG